jgi:predicted nucleic acid-binding protein
MIRVFIDAAPLISLVNPRDQYHKKIVQAFDDLNSAELITTDAVDCTYASSNWNSGFC